MTIMDVGAATSASTDLTGAGRPLPGWGQTLRRPGRAAIMFAAFASLSLAGCQAVVPSVTTAVAYQSGPAGLRAGIEAALVHLDAFPRPVSSPFHLVAFTGTALDEQGKSTPAVGSGWTFVFSRYAEGGPTNVYETVTVAVPGVGTTSVTQGQSSDPALSPIENWDAGRDSTSPDSKELLAPLVAQKVATAGAKIALSNAIITITASGRSTTYDTSAGTFAAVM